MHKLSLSFLRSAIGTCMFSCSKSNTALVGKPSRMEMIKRGSGASPSVVFFSLCICFMYLVLTTTHAAARIHNRV